MGSRFEEEASNMLMPMIECSKCMCLVIILLNALTKCGGTLLAICVGRKGFNKNVFFMFLI